MNILVSSCLLGIPCRYDGQSKPCEAVRRLAGRHRLIPVCPEVLGGLPTPREPSEIRPDGRVYSRTGQDVSEAYLAGAREALRIARLHGCSLAILKEKSPSCGCGRVYDGSFTHTLTAGDGICTALLRRNGIRVIGESSGELEELFTCVSDSF